MLKSYSKGRKTGQNMYLYNITLTLDICEDKFSYKLNFFVMKFTHLFLLFGKLLIKPPKD